MTQLILSPLSFNYYISANVVMLTTHHMVVLLDHATDPNPIRLYNDKYMKMRNRSRALETKRMREREV